MLYVSKDVAQLYCLFDVAQLYCLYNNKDIHVTFLDCVCVFVHARTHTHKTAVIWAIKAPPSLLPTGLLKHFDLSQVADDLTMSQHLRFKELLTVQYVTWQAGLTQVKHSLWEFSSKHIQLWLKLQSLNLRPSKNKRIILLPIIWHIISDKTKKPKNTWRASCNYWEWVKIKWQWNMHPSLVWNGRRFNTKQLRPVKCFTNAAYTHRCAPL